VAKLFGEEYSREELLRKTGNLSQVCGMEEFTFNSGRAKGVDAIDVNAGDLKFTVLNTRCLDIGQASYKGIPFAYLSKSGLRSPEYFVEDKGKGFLDSFYGGLLTTCGLNNIGADCVVDGRAYGVHGEISNIPAEMISKRVYWEDDQLNFEISGMIRHSRFYAEDLVLERVIQTSLGSKTICIKDVIENRDFKSIPLMLLYHINLGFPLLDSGSKLYTSKIKRSWPRTPSAAKGLANFATFSDPVDEIEEECFYHEFDTEDGIAMACLFNPKLGNDGMGVYIKYDTNQLPVIIQWKMMRSREYVCGLNPATTYGEGRKQALEKNEAVFIDPLEKREFSLEIGLTEGDELISHLHHP
jgi:hypothetical protein